LPVSATLNLAHRSRGAAGSLFRSCGCPVPVRDRDWVRGPCRDAFQRIVGAASDPLGVVDPVGNATGAASTSPPPPTHCFTEVLWLRRNSSP